MLSAHPSLRLHLQLPFTEGIFCARGSKSGACPHPFPLCVQAVQPRWACQKCRMSFLHLGAMTGHALKTRHDTGLRQCGACRRVSVLAPPQQLAWMPGGLGEEEAWQREQLEAATGVAFSVEHLV